MKNIDITELRDAMLNDLKTYTAEVTERLDEAVKECIDTARDEAAANSPVKSGKYQKGWYSGTSKRKSYTVGYAANRPGRKITHLLEKGHKARHIGIGPAKWVKAIPHIEPAQDKAMELLDEKIKKILNTD